MELTSKGAWGAFSLNLPDMEKRSDPGLWTNSYQLIEPSFTGGENLGPAKEIAFPSSTTYVWRLKREEMKLRPTLVPGSGNISVNSVLVDCHGVINKPNSISKLLSTSPAPSQNRHSSVSSSGFPFYWRYDGAFYFNFFVFRAGLSSIQLSPAITDIKGPTNFIC